MSRQNLVLFFVIWLTLSILGVLLNRNTNATNVGNNISKRQEYERVLLGCHTAGAIDSDHVWLRELCDEELPKIRAELND